MNELDIFFCTAARNDPLREAMAHLCLQRWLLATVQSRVKIRILAADRASLPSACCEHQLSYFSFQKDRRTYADAHASGQIYVLADDDCLPGPEDFVETCLQVIERHPKFGILSLWPKNAKINPWRPADYEPWEGAEVVEHVSVGGIRFCRKGLLADWPRYDGHGGYDAGHCQALREAGYRVGFFRYVFQTHLGEGYTTVWRELEAAGVH